jgi:hypothetical protein
MAAPAGWLSTGHSYYSIFVSIDNVLTGSAECAGYTGLTYMCI